MLLYTYTYHHRLWEHLFFIFGHVTSLDCCLHLSMFWTRILLLCTERDIINRQTLTLGLQIYSVVRLHHLLIAKTGQQLTLLKQACLTVMKYHLLLTAQEWNTRRDSICLSSRWWLGRKFLSRLSPTIMNP